MEAWQWVWRNSTSRDPLSSALPREVITKLHMLAQGHCHISSQPRLEVNLKTFAAHLEQRWQGTGSPPVQLGGDTCRQGSHRLTSP